MNPLLGNFYLNRKVTCIGLILILAVSSAEARNEAAHFGPFHALAIVVFAAASAGFGYMFAPEGFYLPDKEEILPDYLIEYDLVHADGRPVKDIEVLASNPAPKQVAAPSDNAEPLSDDDPVNVLEGQVIRTEKETEEEPFLYYLLPARLISMKSVEENLIAESKKSHWSQILIAWESEADWRQNAWDSYIYNILWAPLYAVFSSKSINRNKNAMTRLYKPSIGACLGFDLNSKLRRLHAGCYMEMYQSQDLDKKYPQKARILKAANIKKHFDDNIPLDLPEFGLWSDRRMSRLERKEYCFLREGERGYELTNCAAETP